MTCRDQKKHAFTIPLWDHWASQLPPSPEIRTVARIDGIEVEFWLRQVGAHLYFQPVSVLEVPELSRYETPRGGSPFPPDRSVFACFNPLLNYDVAKVASASDKLLPHFHQSLQSGEWGILDQAFAHTEHGCQLCLTGWKGEGRLRYWWDDGAGLPTQTRTALPFQNSWDLLCCPSLQAPVAGLFHWLDWDKSHPVSCKLFATEVMTPYGLRLRTQPMTDSERRDQPVTWLAGNETDFCHLVHWICHSSDELWSTSQEIRIHIYGGMPFRAPAVHLPDYHWASRHPSKARMRFLTELITKWHVCVGHSWIPSPKAEEQTELRERAEGWVLQDLCPQRGKTSIVVPSHHERLEAKLNLRDWLRTKMDSMDVDLIINHPTGYLDHETITRLYHQYLR